MGPIEKDRLIFQHDSARFRMQQTHSVNANNAGLKRSALFF